MEDKCWIDHRRIREVRIDEAQKIIQRIDMKELEGVDIDFQWIVDGAIAEIIATIRGTKERQLKETIQVPDRWQDHFLYGICSMPMPWWLNRLAPKAWDRLRRRIRWRTISIHETHVRLCPHLSELKRVPNGHTIHIAWLAGEDTWRKNADTN